MGILQSIVYGILVLYISGFINVLTINNQSCNLRDYFNSIIKTKNYQKKDNSIYIIYDVNPYEGFNLRRDVYIRMAVFIHNLKKIPRYSGVKLVLPPFPRLYHWKSSHLNQDGIFWNHFFDMDSLRLFVPVVDFYEFIEETTSNSASLNIKINNVIQLQHFEEMFENGVFIDKFEFADCSKSTQSYKQKPLLGYDNITEYECSCLKFQGSSTLLEKVLEIILKKNEHLPISILFLNAEIVLHDHWGNLQFWQARRSMRFNKNLIDIANLFRIEHFNSSDQFDSVQRPKYWTDEKEYRGAKGGEYLCGHLRRADFLYGHENTTPSLKSAANQIRAKLKELNLNKVFISSDCSKFEFKNLKSYLARNKVYRFIPESLEQKENIKDGGQAIIDQIICSHARYFIGTYESTFTYRIYEEREILGFPKENTFNTFCKNEDLSNCEKNSVWPIVY